jgi:hypothetical protein
MIDTCYPTYCASMELIGELQVDAVNAIHHWRCIQSNSNAHRNRSRLTDLCDLGLTVVPRAPLGTRSPQVWSEFFFQMNSPGGLAFADL